MISVEYLYQKVNDLLVKNQSGYSSNDEFNRDLALAQSYLFNFLLPPDDNNELHESLKNFISSVTGTGSIPLPANWAYKLNAKAHAFSGGFSEHPAYFLATDEDFLELSSPIRKPSVKTRSFAYKVDGSSIVCYPQTVPFTVTYLRHPIAAVRGVTLDTVNDVENYNAGTTTDLEWPELETDRFVDILTYLRGAQVNKSEIVNWMQAKQIVKND